MNFIPLLFRETSHTRVLIGTYLVFGGFLTGIVLTAHAVVGWRLLFPRPTETARAAVLVREEIPPPPQQYTRRLDGVLVASQPEADAVPVGIMVENLTTTRPQSGLGAARVVYETLAEGGITRFLALFLPGDDVGKIGPVRSARHYYVDWVEEYGAPYAHAGGSPQALGQISRDKVPDLNGIGGAWRYFWRDRSMAAPHNLFTNGEQLARAMQELGYATEARFEPWVFEDPQQPAVPEPLASTVTVNFSSPAYAVLFTYDRGTNAYLRSNGGTPHLDRSTDRQLRADNVIVQFVRKPIPLGEKARIDLETEGEGKAVVVRNGHATEGTWKKNGTAGRTQFFTVDGSKMILNRGVTWVLVVPEDRPVQY